MHGSGLLRLDRALGGGVGVPLPLRGGRASTARRVAAASASGGSAGGGGSTRKVTNRDLDGVRQVLGPQPGPVPPPGRSPTDDVSSLPPSERPLFPPTDMPSDPDLTAAIQSAGSWQQLRELYVANARRMDPAQLYATIARLAVVTGAVVWVEGAPLPEPTTLATPEGAEEQPLISERDAKEVVALGQSLSRAAGVCIVENLYGMRQVAAMLQCLVALGVALPAAWLRAVEVVVLRTQQDSGEEKAATRLLSTELLSICASFQRLAHVPQRSMVQLLEDVSLLELVQLPTQQQGGEEAPVPVPGQGQPQTIVVVLTATQLLCIARAVLLWGLQPQGDWSDRYLQATYARITRANALYDKIAAAPDDDEGATLSYDEAKEAAEAEEALGVEGLGALLWAAIVLGARPADPENRWMSEFTFAAQRRLQEVVEAPQEAEVVAPGGPMAAAAGAAGEEGPTLQDLASLLSAYQQMVTDPGVSWTNRCLQAADVLSEREERRAGQRQAAAGDAAGLSSTAGAGDALGAIMFLCAQYDHPQDDQSRNAVVAMAARAQAWMQRQADALAAVLDQQVSRKRKSKGQQQQQQQQAGEQGPLPEVVFGPRGLTQLLMGLVRMGGRPSREWMGTWGSAAMMLAVPGAEQLGGVTRTAGGRSGFDLDQVIAVFATCLAADVSPPPELQLALVGGVLLPPPPPPAAPTPTGAAAATLSAGVAGPGAFLPAGGVALATTAAAVAESAAASGVAIGGGVRTMQQFRQLMDILDLQPFELPREWLVHFVPLVEDFRLRFSARDVVCVLRALASFKDVQLVQPRAAPIAPPRVGPAAPTPKPSSATTSSGGGSILLSPDGLPYVPPAATAADDLTTALEAARAGTAGGDEAGPYLSAPWVGGLLSDLQSRGGPRDGSELTIATRALAEMQAGAELLSYMEVFTINLTDEDGRPKPRPKPAAAAAAPKRAPAALTPPAAGTSGKDAAGSADAEKPGKPTTSPKTAARLRLALQRQQAAAAPGSQPQQQQEQQQQMGAEEAEAARLAAEAEAEELAEWQALWPFMLAAFAAAQHVPEDRWWRRFGSATRPDLEGYQAPQLAATAVAALQLSQTAAAAGAAGNRGAAADAELMLPSMQWHQEAFDQVVRFIQSCPLSVEQVKAQALELLREQQQQQGDSTQPPSNPSPDGDAGTQFTGEQFRQACLQVSAVLPNMLVQLTAPRVVLPAALCEVLGEMGIQVAVAAANAVEGGAAAGQAQQEGEQQQGDAELEAVVYAQQLLTFCMQAFIASETDPGEEWMRAAVAILLWTRPEWGPTGEAGQLEQQEQLVLNADQLVTLAYLCGHVGCPLPRERRELMLQHALRLVRAGQEAAAAAAAGGADGGAGGVGLGGGPLAAFLEGMSALPPAPDGGALVQDHEREVAQLLEALSSQAGRLSPDGLASACTALLQLSVRLAPEQAVRFRPAVARSMPVLTARQMLLLLTAAESVGLEPPPRELLTLLTAQVRRLALDPHPLGPMAAVDAAYTVLRWFPSVATAAEAETYPPRLAEGVKLLWNRLEDVGPAAAPRLALLLPTLGCMRPDGAPGSRSPDARAQALADLCLAGMNTADYGIEQLSDAIMGLTLLGVVLSSAWMERFLEVSRLQLSMADGRGLSYILAGLADQKAAPDGLYVTELWEAVAGAAAPPARSFDAFTAKSLLKAAGELGQRPSRPLMQAVLDCVLLRYREAPAPNELVELVQVLSSFGYVPTVGWRVEVRSLLGPLMADLPPQPRAEVARFLQQNVPTDV